MSLLRQTLLRRVVLALLIAFSIAWVVLILFQYAEVRFQESANPALHDAAAQVADVLTGVDDPSEARIISAAIDHSIARARQRRQIPGAVLLQVSEREDRSLVFSSPAAAGAVLQGDPARQTRQVLHGDSYEVVKLDTSRWSILLAQSSLDTGWVLGALSADLTKYVLIAFPFVLLPIWLAVSRGLGPLRQLSERIARRSPEDLTPIGIEPRYEELKPLVVSLDTLLAQLRRKIDNEQTFLATVAHELRTPLAVINAQATVLAKAANEQERLEAEQRMNAAIVRHAHLVHQLLVLARMETAQPADVAEVDLAMLAREEIGNLVPAALAREIEIALEAPETLIFPVEVSAFQSALQNLLDNAIRYGRDGGRIVVELQRGDGILTIAVSDDGPGIADSDRARVFQRFYRGSMQNRSGAGLGLTIVKHATARMGGEVRLSSGQDGRGCCFEVRIPAVLGRVAEERKPSSIPLV